jgi:hypothetical protein
MPDPRSQIGGIVFMAVWIVVWTAAILIAIYSLGAEALDGEFAAMVFLAIWIGAALFALSRAGRTLAGMLSGQPGPKRRPRHHRWNDDLPEPRGRAPAAPRSGAAAAPDGATPPLPPDASPDDGPPDNGRPDDWRPDDGGRWTERPGAGGRGARHPRRD